MFCLVVLVWVLVCDIFVVGFGLDYFWLGC